MRKYRLAIAAVLAIVGAGGCGERRAADPTPVAEAAVDREALLAEAIDDPLRPAADRARDQWRHPKETLAFFGVEPSMTVVEIWPGGGWYTQILAPYLHAGGGAYVAAHLDPSSGSRAADAVSRFQAAFSDQERFGAVTVTTLERVSPGSADVVLTFRNAHNWIAADTAPNAFNAFYAMLKPGGVLGVVDHRANEAGDEDAATGYVKESSIRALAEAAGFEFVAASEINANPADTKDHPFGVWTLPPTRRSSASPGQEDLTLDRKKYDAIGESDRMTLKFAKPAS